MARASRSSRRSSTAPRDRGAGIRLHAVHLHRVRADVLPHRRGALPLRAAGRGGGVRDARQLLAVAHARADAGEVSAPRDGRGRARSRAIRSSGASGLRALASNASATATGPAHRAGRRRASSRCSWVRASPLLLGLAWPGFFPHRWRPVQLAPARQDRHAHRGDRAPGRSRRGAIRQEIPRASWTTILDNIGLPYCGINWTHSNCGLIGTADADILVSLKRITGRPPITSGLARVLPEEFPGVTFYFLPADIVSQMLNSACPRPSTSRSRDRPAGQPPRRRAAAGQDPPCARRRRCADPAARRLSPSSTSTSTAPRPARRTHRKRCRQQRAQLAERQLPGRADVLAQPANGVNYNWPRRRRNTGSVAGALETIPVTGAARRARHAGRRRLDQRVREIAVGLPLRYPPVIDISARCRAATSARSPRHRPDRRRQPKALPRGSFLPCADRSRRCAPAISVCSPGWCSRSCSSTC